jgi:uncharacterized membrane protein YczE
VPLSFGTVVIATSFVVLLAWIPLRQWPGLGTISNAIVIGLVTDLSLHVLDRPDALWLRIAFLTVGIVANGFATALYIGAQFGAGPRDGLMTGLVRRTGLSVRVVRTSIEATVLAAGLAARGRRRRRYRRLRPGHRAHRPPPAPVLQRPPSGQRRRSRRRQERRAQRG